MNTKQITITFYEYPIDTHKPNIIKTNKKPKRKDG